MCIRDSLSLSLFPTLYSLPFVLSILPVPLALFDFQISYLLTLSLDVYKRQLIKVFEKVSGKPLNYKIVGRREGDIEQIWAQPDKANKVLGWKAEATVEETMASAWKWQQRLKEKGIM